MKLRFTPQAIENLTAIIDYLNARNPQGSKRVRTAILDTFRLLLLFPDSGRVLRQGMRKIVTRRYGYVVYYSVDDVAEELTILSVRHAAQQRDPSDA